MKIIRDTREQDGYSFEHERYAETTIEVGTLDTGDYSLSGLTDKVAAERKSIPDLVACLSRERERFARELLRGAALDAFCVAVEGSFTELANGQYRSQMNPHAACQSVAAFTARYNIPFVFCGSRSAAEYFVHSFLRQYLEGAQKRLKAIVKAHGSPADAAKCAACKQTDGCEHAPQN